MKLAPGACQALSQMEAYVKQTGLEQPLFELVKTRASQINGCAFCLAMHTRDARRAGESEDRLHLLNAWHEAPCYTDRERAALAWTEAVTLVSETHIPDDVFEEAKQAFHRDRAGQSHHGGDRDQQLEPHGDRLPRPTAIGRELTRTHNEAIQGGVRFSRASRAFYRHSRVSGNPG